MSPKLTVPWPNQYTVASPPLNWMSSCGLQATGEHVPLPVHCVPSAQRVKVAPLPSAAHVAIVFAVSHVTAPGVQVGATQAATPACCPQLPPGVAAQSRGGRAAPAASQRFSTVPVQLAVFGVQPAEATGMLLG